MKKTTAWLYPTYCSSRFRHWFSDDFRLIAFAFVKKLRPSCLKKRKGPCLKKSVSSVIFYEITSISWFYNSGSTTFKITCLGKTSAHPRVWSVVCLQMTYFLWNMQSTLAPPCGCFCWKFHETDCWEERAFMRSQQHSFNFGLYGFDVRRAKAN